MSKMHSHSLFFTGEGQVLKVPARVRNPRKNKTANIQTVKNEAKKVKSRAEAKLSVASVLISFTFPLEPVEGQNP